METRRLFFVDSVSTNQVQLRRVPGQPNLPDSMAGIELHQITITTGGDSAANADTAFWQTNCQFMEVIIRRKG